MADYKELLRKAVEALPENNGAARRAVYEKARAALVGQLRAINPPLPARDITTHRLQLEDCIRQVEQAASEANISGIGQDQPSGPTTLPPVFAAEARANPPAKPAEAPKPSPAKTEAPKASPAKVDAPRPKSPASKPMLKVEPPKPSNSIESIIAAAERDRASEPARPMEAEAAPERPANRERPMDRPVSRDKPAPRQPEPAAEDDEPVATKGPELKPRPKSQPVLVAKTDRPESRPDSQRPNKPMPSIVARAEAAKGRPISPGFGVDTTRRGPTIEPRRDRNSGLAAVRQAQPMEFDAPEDLEAMSAVREVEVEPPAEAQGAIDRAIAALETEVRGNSKRQDQDFGFDDEPMQAPRRNGSNGRASQLLNARDSEVSMAREQPARSRPAKEFATPRRASSNNSRYAGVPRAQAERRGLGAVTIFMVIFAVLVIGAGGAGFWAWQEGFINLDAMFGKGNTTAAAVAQAPAVTPDSTGPGNTETPATKTASTELQGDRLPVQTAAADSTEPLALQAPAGDKTEERLGAADAPQTAADATVAAIDPANSNGNQSLLLEASDNGTTGAVPFSGTVEWSKGVDENGLPTLIGKANIPARNLSVQMLIRKNSDPSLPASHLMEINFTVSDSFIGGSIAGLPGVLLKNEELVQGAPLVGASARVVGNSFLFALSATPEDNTANINLMTSRKWMDLALIYASGKRAIITLEKDDAAQRLFKDVFAVWGKTAKG